MLYLNVDPTDILLHLKSICITEKSPICIPMNLSNTLAQFILVRIKNVFNSVVRPTDLSLLQVEHELAKKYNFTNLIEAFSH